MAKLSASGRSAGRGGRDLAPPMLYEKPRGPSGCGLWLLVFLFVLGIGATVGWQMLDRDQREKFTAAAAEFVRETPLDFLRTYLLPRLEVRPPVPPINESGDHGVIPMPGSQGPSVQAGISETPAPAASPEPGVLPPEPADERVQPAFIDDLAGWVIARYSGGSLSVSVQALNQRYGTQMTGLAGSRASLLRYAFTPSMVRGIYGMYADPFLRALAQRAEEGERPLSESQLRALYQTLGSRCALLAGGLDSVASLPDLRGRLRLLDQREDEVTAANRGLMDARFELDQAREGAAGMSVAEAQRRTEAAAAQLRNSMAASAEAQRRLAEDIQRQGAGALNQETLLYLARWTGRRLAENPSALESVRASAGVLRDLAGRCARAAREGAPVRQAPQPAAPEAVPAASEKPLPAAPAPAPALPAGPSAAQMQGVAPESGR